MNITNSMVINADWQVPNNIKAFTTTVVGGVSVGSCQGLNLGTHVGDNPIHVLENRQRLQQHMGDGIALCWLNQTHSDIIIDADNYQGGVEADAAVASKINTAAVVMTADCLPVLMCNRSGSRVAALHCGWKGLYQNLIAKTIRHYFNNDEVIAWLGPAIGQQSYEVDEPLYQRFIAANPNYQEAFTANRPGHYLFDLYAIARQQLMVCGLSSTAIYGGGFDTFSDSRFYSHRQNPNSGRIASVIYRV